MKTNSQGKKDKNYSTGFYLGTRKTIVESFMCREDYGKDTHPDGLTNKKEGEGK
jgi:hypothetical protein